MDNGRGARRRPSPVSLARTLLSPHAPHVDLDLTVARALVGLRLSWVTATVLRCDAHWTTSAPAVVTGKRARTGVS